MGRVFAFFANRFLKQSFSDTQCGFKLFRGEIATQLFELARLDRFAFDVEILFLAGLFNYRVTEIPVNWRDISGSRVNLIKDPWEMFSQIFKIRKLHTRLEKFTVVGTRSTDRPTTSRYGD